MMLAAEEGGTRGVEAPRLRAAGLKRRKKKRKRRSQSHGHKL